MQAVFDWIQVRREQLPTARFVARSKSEDEQRGAVFGAWATIEVGFREIHIEPSSSIRLRELSGWPRNRSSAGLVDHESHPHRTEHDVIAGANFQRALGRDTLPIDEGSVGRPFLLDEETLAAT